MGKTDRKKIVIGKNESVEIITIFGRNFKCELHYVEIRRIVDLKSVTQVGFTGQCNPLETPVLVKMGKSYKMLSDGRRFVSSIIAVKARQLLCAVLVDAQPCDTKSVALLATNFPPLPLFIRFGKGSGNVREDQNSIAWLRSSFLDQLGNGAETSALLQSVIGKKVTSKNCINNNNPNKNKTAKDHWNELRKERGGKHYERIIEIIEKEDHSSFRETIFEKIDNGEFEPYFDRVQERYIQRSGGNSHV